MAVDTSALLAKLKQKKAQYSRNNSKVVKLKEGKTRIRILPAPNMVDADHPLGERDLGVHWIKTSKNGKPVCVVGCPEITYGQLSVINPVLEAAAKAAVDDETLAVIKENKAKKSVLVNAVIRDGADASEDPQILELTPTTFGQVLSIIETYIEGGRTDILDPTNGMDLIVERKGKGMDTEYTVMVAPTSKPLAKGVEGKAADIDAFIASEFFRGEEKKAIAAISAMMGGLPGIAGPSTTAMLTSARPVEEVTERPAPAARPALAPKPAPAAAPEPEAVVEEPPFVEDDEEAKALAALEAARVKKAAAAKAAAAKPAPAPVPTAPAAAPADEFGAKLDDAELDAMLADLDNIK